MTGPCDCRRSRLLRSGSKAKSFTIDGEAVVLRSDGLSRFDELRRRGAAHSAMLYAFDLIEHDEQDLRDHPFLDRKAALARLLRGTDTHILFNEHVAGDGPTVFVARLPAWCSGLNVLTTTQRHLFHFSLRSRCTATLARLRTLIEAGHGQIGRCRRPSWIRCPRH